MTDINQHEIEESEAIVDALISLVPAELRARAEDVERRLEALNATALDTCQETLEVLRALDEAMKPAETALASLGSEDFLMTDDLGDAAWKITSAVSGAARIREALYGVRNLLDFAADRESVEASRK
jgi:hypothetical protein